MVATATLKTRSIQGETLSAVTDRLVNSVLLTEGVVNKAGNSFQVLQNLGTDMNVKIGSGTAFDRAVVQGDLAGQGVFVPEHQNATQVLAVAASDPTLDRIDNVILRIYDDTFDSSGFDYADLEVTTGTPDASPVPPAVPAGSFVLAEILVQNAVTQIVNGDITDSRHEAGLRPEVMPTIKSRAVLTGASNLSTTEETKVTANLVIPADWNSYDVDIMAAITVQPNTPTAPANCTVRLKVGTTLAGDIVEELSNNTDDDVAAISPIGFLEGETTIGTVAVTLTTQLSTQNLLYQVLGRTLIVVATRVT